MSETQKRSGAGARLRAYFLTGLIVVAPLFITIYLTWSAVLWVDGWVKPYLPAGYNIDTYLPFNLPGYGLLVALVTITLIGFLTANLVGRTIVGFSESLLDRTPFVRAVYKGFKQLFQTVLSDQSNSFKRAGLIEFPRKGVWSIVFIATDAKGEIDSKLPDHDTIAVFLPAAPLPSSGFLLFVPREDVIMLDMSVEEAAKMMLSAGLVAPPWPPQQAPASGKAKLRKPAAE